MTDDSDSGWELLYRSTRSEDMPWYYPDLDPDFRSLIEELEIEHGDVLDLGTGPATQAIALAKLGFRVTASDISATAVARGKALSRSERVDIDFIEDDILNSRLEKTFDVVFDRGCFHVISPGERITYVTKVLKILRPGGFLLLKCFSHREPGTSGPYRLSPEDIRGVFSSRFEIRAIRESQFAGNRRPFPHALVCVLKKP